MILQFNRRINSLVIIKYSPLTKMGDNLLMYKYIIKNIARKNNMVATFMPKPLFADNGSGMHCHQSIWKNGVNLFYDKKGYANVSQLALYYIGGLLKHAPSLMAFCAPTTSLLKREMISPDLVSVKKRMDMCWR